MRWTWPWGGSPARSLVRVNRSTDELEPWLAESFIAASGNLIYTVKLRPGLTSADGTALTAAERRDIAGVAHREGAARRRCARSIR